MTAIIGLPHKKRGILCSVEDRKASYERSQTMLDALSSFHLLLAAMQLNASQEASLIHDQAHLAHQPHAALFTLLPRGSSLSLYQHGAQAWLRHSEGYGGARYFTFMAGTWTEVSHAEAVRYAATLPTFKRLQMLPSSSALRVVSEDRRTTLLAVMPGQALWNELRELLGQDTRHDVQVQLTRALPALRTAC